MRSAVDYLQEWLKWHHSFYTINDIKPSKIRGYLETTKICNCKYPPYDGYTNFISAGIDHYHTIYIGGITGFGRGIYAFWREVIKELGGRRE